MVDAPYCEACDSGHDVPCTCTYAKIPFTNRSEVKDPIMSMACGSCEKQTMELFENQCEPCFKRDKIEPLMALRELTLKEVARIDGLLTAKLEKLARSSRHNINLSFTCVCGERQKSGLDMINHLASCTGPRRPVHRNGNYAKVAHAINPEEVG